MEDLVEDLAEKLQRLTVELLKLHSATETTILDQFSSHLRLSLASTELQRAKTVAFGFRPLIASTTGPIIEQRFAWHRIGTEVFRLAPKHLTLEHFALIFFKHCDAARKFLEAHGQFLCVSVLCFDALFHLGI